MFISITFISFLFCLGGEETYFEGENLLGEKCLTCSVQTSSCSRCYVGITMQMGIVSAIIAVSHSSPSPAEMEEHEYSLYITGKESEWSCVGDVIPTDHVYCIGHVTVT